MHRRVVCSILLAVPGMAAATQPATPPAAPSAPAIGYDWMPDPQAAADDPDPWPRADATDTGLDEMIRAERRPLETVIGPADGVARPQGVDQRLLHTLRKVGGDYVVVPVFTLHLDRANR